MCYLGVDGGGTKTAFCLIDGAGNILLERSYGTCYVSEVGKEGARAVFRQFEKDMKCLGKDFTSITRSFLGMPGFTEAPQWDTLILEVLQECFGSRFECANDCVVGWAGSLACRPGVNLVAGTGAIAFGRDEAGQSARISGWGPTIGDEGSAYWLGIQALQLFSKQSDGRAPRGPFYDILKKHLNLHNDQDLIDLVYNQWAGVRAEIASLSVTISQAALEGDAGALLLIKKTAEECFLMVEGLSQKLDFGPMMTVSYSGGVFNMGDILLNPLKAKLSSLGAQLKPPVLSPVRGAALYAFMSDHPEPAEAEGVVQKLQNS